MRRRASCVWVSGAIFILLFGACSSTSQNPGSGGSAGTTAGTGATPGGGTGGTSSKGGSGGTVASGGSGGIAASGGTGTGGGSGGVSATGGMTGSDGAAGAPSCNAVLCLSELANPLLACSMEWTACSACPTEMTEYEECACGADGGACPDPADPAAATLRACMSNHASDYPDCAP